MPKFKISLTWVIIAGMLFQNTFLMFEQINTSNRISEGTKQSCITQKKRTQDIVAAWVEFSKDTHLIAIKQKYAANSWKTTKNSKFRSNYWADMATREDDLSRYQLSYAHRVENDYDSKTCGPLPSPAPPSVKSH